MVKNEAELVDYGINCRGCGRGEGWFLPAAKLTRSIHVGPLCDSVYQAISMRLAELEHLYNTFFPFCQQGDGSWHQVHRCLHFVEHDSEELIDQSVCPFMKDFGCGFGNGLSSADMKNRKRVDCEVDHKPFKHRRIESSRKALETEIAASLGREGAGAFQVFTLHN